jgi:solute carrier family 45 protein 1/2/4
VGHIIFIAAVMSSSFATNVMQACFLLSFVGLSWAITQWLPYVILGEEIAKQMGLQDEETKSDSPLGAGTIISLHNSSISLPQILSAAMCSGVFELMTKLEKADATAWALRVSTFGAVVAAILTFCDM